MAWNMFRKMDDWHDKQTEKRIEGNKRELPRIQNEARETKYNEEGELECVLFSHRERGTVRIRVLSLFRLRGISSDVRLKTSNKEVFESILQDFGDGNVSFVALYSGGSHENTIVSYGVLVEGGKEQEEALIRKACLYRDILERKFRSCYNNLDIEKFRYEESYVFAKFGYNNLVMLRGIPRGDNGRGAMTGTSYTPQMGMGRQVSETLLRGFEAARSGKKMKTEPFLFLVILDPLHPMEVLQAVELLTDRLSQALNSSMYNKAESDSVSIPMLFSPSVGDAYADAHGTSHQLGKNESNSDALAKTWNTGETSGMTQGTSDTHTNNGGTTEQKGSSKMDGVNNSINIPFIGGWGGNENKTASHSETELKTYSDATANTLSRSHQVTNGAGGSATHAHAAGTNETNGTSNTSTQSKNKGMGANVGASPSESMIVSRTVQDAMASYASEVIYANLTRYQRGINDGMYEMRMMLLTETQEGKILGEEILKQAMKDEMAPIPIRIQRFEVEEEKRIKEFVKTMAKPFSEEKRKHLAEWNRYTTFVTTSECAALNPPQDNLTGYISSYDSIPPSAAKPGVMEEGVAIGNQIDINQNIESEHEYRIPLRSLGHIGVFGNSGQGKTEVVKMLIKELRRRNVPVLVLDWAENHRTLLSLVQDKSKFRYNSFKPGMESIRFNLLAIPKGVSQEEWQAVVAEVFAHTNGLGLRGFEIIKESLKQLYRKRPNGTMKDLVEEVELLKQRMIIAGNGKLSFREDEVFKSIEPRLNDWKDPEHSSYKFFNEGPFLKTEDLLEKDCLQLIECAALPVHMRKFVVNIISTGMYLYVKARGIALKKPMYIVLEEAHTILEQPVGTDSPLPVSETIFETMSREARNYALFLVYVCQQPQKVQEQIFGNLMITITFQLTEEEGRKRVVASGGRDPNRFDVDMVKWIGMQPRGTCLVRLNSFGHIREGQFVPVKVHYEPTLPMRDEFFKAMYQKNKVV